MEDLSIKLHLKM